MRFNETGKRYGRLSVMTSAGRDRYVVKCDCGTEHLVRGTRLRAGSTQSCGCLKIERTIARKTKHGHASRASKPSMAYRAWAGMRNRCNNPNIAYFAYYGGRGISVCDRWNDYANFLSDMGEPAPGLTLDRIDCDGNYEPSNCRWATRLEQVRNRRVSVTRSAP